MSDETPSEPNAFELENIYKEGTQGAYDSAVASFVPDEPDAAFKVMGEIRHWGNLALWRAGRASVTPPTREALERVLTENGVDPDGSTNMHSWRCEHVDRYGQCDCFEVLLAELVAVAVPPTESEGKWLNEK